MQHTEQVSSLTVYNIEEGVLANGPGERVLVTFGGCSLGCRGCFNKHTWSTASGEPIPASRLANQLAASKYQGVTLSGGEPLQQAAMGLFLELLNKACPEKTVIMFSGYYVEEIDPKLLNIMKQTVDLLVAGRYVPTKKTDGRGLIASSNQTIVKLRGNIDVKELDNLPRADIRIEEHGLTTLTGFIDHRSIS